MTRIEAYDREHHKLWLTIGTSPCILLDGEYKPSYLRKKALAIDPNTNKPTDQVRKVAYFRIYQDEVLQEIHITSHGRKAGIRNYQARRPEDGSNTPITGHPALPVKPRIHPVSPTCVDALVGEGDPYSKHGMIRNNLPKAEDRHGDLGIRLATAVRLTKRETNSWSGWLVKDLETGDVAALEGAGRGAAIECMLGMAARLGF